jgi:hypothetical protein
MGQLRTALLNLQKSLVNNPGIVEELKKKVSAESDRIEQLAQTATEGWNSIHLYLFARFEKEGTTIADNKKKTMKDIMDSELATLGKGLESWRKTLLGHCEKASSAFEDGIAALRKQLADAAAENKKLRAIAEKKKSKWLASKEYKAKIKGYLEVIDDIDAIIASQTKAIDKAKGLGRDAAWVNKWYTITAKTTVEDVENFAAMDHHSIMSNYLKDKEEQDKYVHKWRDEYKAMGVQVALMKKWAAEADEMESVE